MSREESAGKQTCRVDAIPGEIKIPDDFEGVIQINVQSQKENESFTQAQAQTQTQNTAVAVSQMQSQIQSLATQINQLQNLMQPIAVSVQQAQSQQQACGQMAAQLQGLQGQMQLLFMAVLGAPAGADAGERQQLLREIVTALRGGAQ